MEMTPYNFSEEFIAKCESYLEKQKSHEIGPLKFGNRLFLAPMSNIGHAPFRLLLQQLGAGGTMSELVSCHGILHGNEKTLNMLRIAKKELYSGIQLFGESPEAMAEAAKVAASYGPKFIDINMGCPVRKVVTKGAGSALMKDLTKLAHYFSTINKELPIPLSVKIRTGWDQDSLNADQVIKIAHDSGLFMVSMHGRTRSQKYMGKANWEYIEDIAVSSPLPLVGNGDLICPRQIKEKLEKTNCAGLMIGRGALRNPFIFLESHGDLGDPDFFAEDYIEIIKALSFYLDQAYVRERFNLIQLKKFVVWFAAGFNKAAKFRSTIFPSKDKNEVLNKCYDYFGALGKTKNKVINPTEEFLMSGHG